jgi:hypothetical protein
MEIPEYFIKRLLSHYKRIVENAKHNSTDYRTAEAVRLAKLDINKLQKLLQHGNGK